MWLLAIAVAIAGAAALQDAGLIDLSKTLYTGNRVGWLRSWSADSCSASG
jgi:hypothetical protein